MPIYEYRCPKCGIFEVILPVSAENLKACPSCGQKVQKLISKPAVIYNCSGFYCTDYNKDNSSACGQGVGKCDLGSE